MNRTLLIGLGAPFYRDEDGLLFVENQTISGLKAYHENFGRVLAYAICHDRRPIPSGYTDAVSAELNAPDFHLEALPDTYDRRIGRQVRGEVERTMLKLMRQADHSVFSYGGWIGDPGEIAASVARANGIPHAVWLDRVDSQVVRIGCVNPLGWLKSRVKSAIISRNENRAVRTAQLAMLHGKTVYDHFSPIARLPRMIEDIHFSGADRISSDGLDAKIADAGSGPLRILYCGRAAPMKGGLQWIETLARLAAQGVDFRATWLGDGPELDNMRSVAGAAGLSDDRVAFTGFVADREVVKNEYRRAQILMFCHLTDESPRNLIESLHSATPLVGYRDPFAQVLVDERGAGALVKRGDTRALAATVAELAGDRGKLADLIAGAGKSASNLTREKVFRDRCEIIAEFVV